MIFFNFILEILSFDPLYTGLQERAYILSDPFFTKLAFSLVGPNLFPHIKSPFGSSRCPNASPQRYLVLTRLFQRSNLSHSCIVIN